MKKYTDYNNENMKWIKYKIVVPTEEDRQELMEAFEHFHYSGFDSDYIAANQLAHEYLDENFHKNNIIVDSEIYNKIKDRYGKTKT